MQRPPRLARSANPERRRLLLQVKFIGLTAEPEEASRTGRWRALPRFVFRALGRLGSARS